MVAWSQVAESDTAVLLDIYVPWCPHCRQFEPKFNEIAQVFAKQGGGGEGGGEVVVAKRLDGYENKIPDAWKAKFPVDGYPTL